MIGQSTIVRFGGDSIETLAFGQGPRDHKSLYGVNFGPFSPVPAPSLFRLPIGVPGAPQPYGYPDLGMWGHPRAPLQGREGPATHDSCDVPTCFPYSVCATVRRQKGVVDR